MTNIDRRTLLKVMGATSLTRSRFRVASSRLRFSPCETISDDFVCFKLPSTSESALVLCVSSDHSSMTASFCSASLADNAERSAPSSIFFGSA